MTTTTLTVTGMTCDHCVQAVTSALDVLDQVDRVDVDLDTGTVVVSSAKPVDIDAVHAAIVESGYEVAP